jgi:hypothetical protein
MREKMFTLLGILITWISIFFVVPHMGFEIKMWVLIVSAFIGGLFAGFIVLLRETVIENIIMVVIVLVLAGILSGTKPGFGFVFISALLSGVIGTITNQINQYLANKALKSETPQSGAP